MNVEMMSLNGAFVRKMLDSDCLLALSFEVVIPMYGDEKIMMQRSPVDRSRIDSSQRMEEAVESESLESESLGLSGGADSQAQAALASSSVVDLRELTVIQSGEDLLISGRVQCFYHKQLAQETVRPHAANLRLVNSVSVER